MISERTIAALAAAKARGQALGNPKLAEARAIANANHTASADTFADSVAPAIREAQAAGAKTLRQIAAALNGRGIGTARGGKWAAAGGRECASPRRVIARPSLPRALFAHNPNRAAQRSCQPIERAFGQADVSSDKKSVSLRSPRSPYSLATL